VVDTLRSGWLTGGPKMRLFEERFREYVGATHAVAVNSCTAGLHLALAAAEIGEGDEVITSPLTFCSCVNVIVHRGATPILADIRLDDYDIDPEQVERKVTPRTRAIMPVHYGGQPCRMDELLDIARRHDLLVIEDAAHAVGARYRERPVGVLGDVTAFSFYATKNMTTGQGGMVTTEREDLAETVRLLSLHGMSAGAWKRYEAKGSAFYQVLAPGFNFAMTDMQAAMGLHQLERLEGFLALRDRYAREYNRRLEGLAGVVVPQTRPEVRHAWHLYAMRLEPERLTIDRDGFVDELRERGIGTSVHFIPIHYHAFYSEGFGFRRGDYPQAEAAYEGLVSLPLYTLMGEADVARVADAVREIVESHQR
jgi:dTDP-4-amino-4,6-dideoxygalactose transaminase